MAITQAPRVRSDAVPLRTYRSTGRAAAIAGLGVFAPEKVLTNRDLERMVDTSDHWITERTGIKERRIAEPGMEMAAKTGTAQVRHISLSEHLAGVRKNENLPWQQRDHALFIAFAPVAAPQYAVCVVVEHGGGGSAVAGPIVHDIMLETQRRNPARTNGAQKLALTGEP